MRTTRARMTRVGLTPTLWDPENPRAYTRGEQRLMRRMQRAALRATLLRRRGTGMALLLALVPLGLLTYAAVNAQPTTALTVELVLGFIVLALYIVGLMFYAGYLRGQQQQLMLAARERNIDAWCAEVPGHGTALSPSQVERLATGEVVRAADELYFAVPVAVPSGGHEGSLLLRVRVARRYLRDSKPLQSNDASTR